MTDLHELTCWAQDLAQQGDWGDDAAEVNQRIIELDPRNVPSRTRLAKCHLSNGREADARALYEEVLRLEPENRIARNWIDQNRISAAVDVEVMQEQAASGTYGRPSSAHGRHLGSEDAWVLRQSAGIFREVFPVIRDLILTESPRLRRPVSREDIGPQLEHHPVVGGIMQRQYRTRSRDKPLSMTYERFCHNQVDFYSAKWTQFESGTIKDGEYEMMRLARLGVRRLDPGNGYKHYRYEPAPSSSVHVRAPFKRG